MVKSKICILPLEKPSLKSDQNNDTTWCKTVTHNASGRESYTSQTSAEICLLLYYSHVSHVPYTALQTASTEGDIFQGK